MPRLVILSALGAVAGGEVELGDDGNDGRQVGLILDHDLGGVEGDVTIGTLRQRHVDRAIDVFRCWERSQGSRMAVGTARFLAAPFKFAAAKTCGLAALGALEFVDLLAQPLALGLQVGDAVFEFGDLTIAVDAARTKGGQQGHKPPGLGMEKGDAGGACSEVHHHSTWPGKALDRKTTAGKLKSR